MAPIIRIKENPGTLRLEVVERQGNSDTLITSIHLPQVRYNSASDELELKKGSAVGNKKFKAAPNEDNVEIQIGT